MRKIMRDVTIHKVMNGYVVQVGCQTLVFETREKLIFELSRYLAAPEQVEKQFLEKYGVAGAVNVEQYAEQYRAPGGCDVTPTPMPGRSLVQAG